LLRIEISYRGILLIAALLVALWAVTRVWPILILIAAAVILMTALLPYVEWLVARGLPRTLAVLTIVFAIILVLAGLFAIVVPAMIDEFSDLRENLPEDARELEEFLDGIGIHVELESRARDINWDRLISGQAAIDYGQRIIYTTISIVTIIVLTAYLLIDMPRLSRFVYQFVPSGREPDFERIMTSLSRVVGGYVRGQAVTSVFIAVYTTVLLLIVDVPNALAFGVLAGFVDIIPIIGAVIAVIGPTAAALQESPEQGIIVAVALLAYQQFEDRFLVPRVYGQTMNLPPIVVLIAVLMGGQLLGIAGVLLALPAAAAGRVFLDYAIERRQALLTPSGPTGEQLAPDTSEPERR
jgi:predicted PurR-regulated permease PerM